MEAVGPNRLREVFDQTGVRISYAAILDYSVNRLNDEFFSDLGVDVGRLRSPDNLPELFK